MTNNERPGATGADPLQGSTGKGASDSSGQLPVGLQKKGLVLKTMLVLAILIAITYVLKVLFSEYLETAGRWFVSTFGYAGVFLGALIIDTINFPLSPDFLLLFSIAGGLDPVLTVLLATAGSITGASLAYWIGRLASRFKPIAWWMERKKEMGSLLFDRYGHWTILAAAVTPLPFGALCWFAGGYRMNYPRFLLITFIRLPRMIVPYLLLYFGWSFL